MGRALGAGRCARRTADGRRTVPAPWALFVEEVGQLVDLTDACARLLGNDIKPGDPKGDHAFAATYAFGRPIEQAILPASRVVWACHDSAWRGRRDNAKADEVARALLEERPQPGPGRLYLACSLLAPLEPKTAMLLPRVVGACLAHGAYHLRIEAMQLVERAARALDEQTKQQVLGLIETLPNDNLFINSAAIEALAAIGATSPMHDLADVLEEIRVVLARDPDDEMTHKLAGGIISCQFEEQEVVGPYCEAVMSLEGAAAADGLGAARRETVGHLRQLDPRRD